MNEQHPNEESKSYLRSRVIELEIQIATLKREKEQGLNIIQNLLNSYGCKTKQWEEARTLIDLERPLIAKESKDTLPDGYMVGYDPEGIGPGPCWYVQGPNFVRVGQTKESVTKMAIDHAATKDRKC